MFLCQIVITVDPKPLLAILGAVAVILAFTVSAASTDIRKALFWYRTPYLWMAVSVVSTVRAPALCCA